MRAARPLLTVHGQCTNRCITFTGNPAHDHKKPAPEGAGFLQEHQFCAAMRYRMFFKMMDLVWVISSKVLMTPSVPIPEYL